MDLTLEQENELLAALWTILRSFVEIGFGLDSVPLFSTWESGAPGDKAGGDSGNSIAKNKNAQCFNRTALQSSDKED